MGRQGWGDLYVAHCNPSPKVPNTKQGDKVGGLMGVLDTSEKLAGVVGPSVGGILYAYSLQPSNPKPEKLAGVVGPSVGGVLYAYSLQPETHKTSNSISETLNLQRETQTIYSKPETRKKSHKPETLSIISSD